MRRQTSLMMLLACALTVPACSSADQPGPTSTRPAPPTSSSTESLRPTTVPTVAAPADLSALRAHPCSALTAAQQRELDFAAKPVEVAAADYGTCIWNQTKPDAGGRQFGYVLRVDTAVDPLADAYRQSAERTPSGDPTWAVFEPGTIAELPAVVRSLADRTTQCEVVVGAGDDQGLSLKGVLRPANPDLCDRLTRAAKLALAAR